MLDRVQSAVTSASSSTLTSVPSSSILVHHSRDTASKQWAETQVKSTTHHLIRVWWQPPRRISLLVQLCVPIDQVVSRYLLPLPQVIVLMGVSRVIHSRLETLSQLDGFPRAWGTLMDTIRKIACSCSKEVHTPQPCTHYCTL